MYLDNKSRIKSNTEVFDFVLTDEEMAELNSFDEGRRYGPDPDTLPGIFV